MSAFQDNMARDVRAVILNVDEFADEHTINGKVMPAIINTIDLEERSKLTASHMDGIYSRKIVMHVAAQDFGPLPPQGDIVTLDRRRYKVLEAVNEFGLYDITMEANRSR